MNIEDNKMDKSGKFLLPSPKFKKLDTPSSTNRHFLSPQGIQLLPKEQQPPPMYGHRGSTLPPKFLSPLKVPTTNNQFDRKQKYFCEPCEAEFHTSTDYKVHKSEHVHCEIDNCKFRGHPAFMDTHIGQQHATGLYEQLKKLSTPEEIAQWRADRKKNYPTVAIVEQKWKAREQRMIRGEKLEMENKKRFGKRGDRRQMKGDKSRENVGGKPESNKRRQNKNKNKKQQRDKKFEKKKKEEVTPPLPKEELPVEPEVEENTSSSGMKMFKGTEGMEDYKKVKKAETNVLSSLLGMYGSDSENDSDSEKEEVSEEKKEQIDTESPDYIETIKLVEDPSEETKINEPEIEQLAPKKVPTDEAFTDSIIEKATEPQSNYDEAPEESAISKTTNIPDKPQSELTRKRTKPMESTSQETPTESIEEKTSEPHSSDDEGPEEAAISKTTTIPDKPQAEPPRKKTKPNPPPKRKSLLDYRKLRGGRQNTMLEKLLEADIRHERNVLLQCVRFVVENNFFDDKPKSA